MNCNKPKLSVIIPIYNVEKYIGRCLDSVLNQNYDPMEVICVDDGSTDGSGLIADDYAKRDSRIHVVHKKNGGLVSARKAGARMAVGSYITNIDSDDFINPNAFLDMMQYLTDMDADLITSQEIRDYENYQINTRPKIPVGIYEEKSLLELQKNLIDTNHFFRCMVSPHVWDKIFRAEPYKRFQEMVPEAITIGEDSSVVFPFILSANRAIVTDTNYYHYCIRPDSMMGSNRKEDVYALDVLEKYIETSFGAFSGTIQNINQQAAILILYNRLFRDLENVIRFDGKVLYPYGKVSGSDKLLLYGSGKFGVQLHTFLLEKKWFARMEWCDTDGKNGACDARKLDLNEFDKIVIAALQADAVEALLDTLKNMGVENDKVLHINLTLLHNENEKMQ